MILESIQILVTLFLGGVGIYFAHNYIRHLKMKTIENKIVAYKRLWSILKMSSPMRKKDWHFGKYTGLLTLEERQSLYKKMSSWYYDDGNGIFLGDSARKMYLNSKQNLLCSFDELKPAVLQKNINRDIFKTDQYRSDLAVEQLSLLRHMLRTDLAVYGNVHFKEMSKLETLFIEGCGESLKDQQWRKSTQK